MTGIRKTHLAQLRRAALTGASLAVLATAPGFAQEVEDGDEPTS